MPEAFPVQPCIGVVRLGGEGEGLLASGKREKNVRFVSPYIIIQFK